jgi:hypothetical protein
MGGTISQVSEKIKLAGKHEVLAFCFNVPWKTIIETEDGESDIGRRGCEASLSEGKKDFHVDCVLKLNELNDAFATLLNDMNPLTARRTRPEKSPAK